MYGCMYIPGAGTQVAIEAADMVLIRSNLNDLVVAFDLASKVFSRVKWNMIWALIYHIVMVPFAAGQCVTIYLFVTIIYICLCMYVCFCTQFFDLLIIRSSVSLDSHADAPAVCWACYGSLVCIGRGVFHVLEAVQGLYVCTQSSLASLVAVVYRILYILDSYRLLC